MSHSVGVSEPGSVRQIDRPPRALRAVGGSGPASGSGRADRDQAPRSRRPRAEWVERPELLEHLAGTHGQAGPGRRAPAGFGKTTLVAQWRASRQRSAGRSPGYRWTGATTIPGRLWWHVVCALQRACPDLDAEDVLASCAPRSPDLTGTVLPLLVNALAALPRPVVLVLDDYHVIKERDCHEQIDFLLRRICRRRSSWCSSPGPIRRCRWPGCARAGDWSRSGPELRFAPREAAALVRAVSRHSSSAGPDLADLVDRTEGWPAGLYLAALSLRGHPSPPSSSAEFTGDNRFIV